MAPAPVAPDSIPGENDMGTMRKYGATTALLVTMGLMGCASAGGGPAAASASAGGSAATSSAIPDPVGVYDFHLTLGGQHRDGVLTIQRDADGWGGSGVLEGENDPAEVTDVKVDGARMIVSIVVPANQDRGTFDLTWNGTDYTGLLYMGENAIEAKATRR